MSRRFPVKDHCKKNKKKKTHWGDSRSLANMRKIKTVLTLNTKTDMWRFKDRPKYGLRKTLFKY